MPFSEPPKSELMKALLSPEQFAEWERNEETRREFWRTLQGPAQRPLASNADEWNLFVSENKDETGYLAVQIAEAIEEAELRGYVRGKQHAELGGAAGLSPSSQKA